MPLTDPTIINKPSRVNPKVLLLYGAAKVGKTTACAQIPDSYLLDCKSTEGGGADYIEYRGSQIHSLKELEEAFPVLQKWNAEKKFKRLIVDTVDALEAWCEEAATDQYMKSVESKKNPVNTVYELAYGAGHHKVRTRFKDLIASLLTCTDELVLIGHLKDKVLDKSEQTVIARDIDLTGKLANIICYMVDATGFVFRKSDNTLRITFATSETLNCGVRCLHLRGKSIELGKMNGDGLVCDWSQIYLPEVTV